MKQDFPPTSTSILYFRIEDSLLLATFELDERSITATGAMSAEQYDKLKSAIGDRRRFLELRSVPEIQEMFDWNKLLIVAQVQNDVFDWDLVREDIVAWMNYDPLPRASRINERRVSSALPTPPQYSLEAVQKSMWVLESESNMSQGSAFDLQSYGTVTNFHVVEGLQDVRAFRSQTPTITFPVKILRFHRALDLAIIDVVGSDKKELLEPGDVNYIKQLAHIAVCGFPNYRLGDSGILSPGIVVGFRQRSGIRRMLTNAGIVAGMSGGPAIGQDSKVLGICTTGADYMQNASETEDHSIIPVDALDLLSEF